MLCFRVNGRPSERGDRKSLSADSIQQGSLFFPRMGVVYSPETVGLRSPATRRSHPLARSRRDRASGVASPAVAREGVPPPSAKFVDPSITRCILQT